jgi:hypothetical protein
LYDKSRTHALRPRQTAKRFYFPSPFSYSYIIEEAISTMASSAAERYFTQVANDVLQATERITQHFEENLSVLFGSSKESTTTPPEDVDEEMLQKNPLQGMAEDVLHGIFDQQVRFL